MPEVFKHKILKFLTRRDYTPLKLGPLAKALGVEADQYDTFKSAFKDLCQSGRVVIGAKSLISLPPPSSKMVGKFRANAKGFGFVTPLEPNAHGDLFIPPGSTMEAMTGDTVSARVVQRGKRSGQMQYSGEIVAILERGHDQLVGTLKRENGFWFVRPDGNVLLEPVSVDDVTAKNASVNDKVVIEIISYPGETRLARGVILEVLGKAGLYDSEIRSVIKQFNLPEELSPECLEQARSAAEAFNPEDIGTRDDICDQIVVTIDPPDAKDFDDAISLVRNLDGNWVLGVHIADVSTFIPMNSPLDIEARERGNSSYLPGKTIPMLPEILSNGICSLQPNQRRFVKSVYITYDNDGHILGRDFANSVMKSFERLTYERANDILNGQVAGEKPEVVSLLKDMERLAEAIEKRRDHQGAIHLNLPEIELIMDKQGKVIDAEPADTSYPHTIIEMFMVEANEAVAALLDRFRVPFMRRIHPDPDSISTNNLQRFVSLCGIKVPRKLDRRAIQDLLASVRGTPAELPINLHVLRSLTRAEYSPLQIGHYALASEHYCHFTSPIRRYADLLVHRLLQCYLEQRLNMIGLEEVLPEAELVEIGKNLSFTEQRSSNAEEELKKVLLLQMLEEHIGESLACVVSGLTNFGIFVQSTRFGIEGLIPYEQLSEDEWRFDERRQCAVSRRAGRTIHLGQPMVCQIVSVNIPARQLNLAPAESLTESMAKTKKLKPLAGRNRRVSDRRRSNIPRKPDRRKSPRRKR